MKDIQEKGLKLVSEGKIATVFLLNEKEHHGSIYDSNMVENEAIDTSIIHMFQKVVQWKFCNGCKLVFNYVLFVDILLVMINCRENLFACDPSDESCVLI